MTHLTLLAFGLFPTTFFFRMAYSEGLFLALTLAVMLAVERRTNLWLIALLVGLTTGTRPVGVALVPVFAMHVWQRSLTWRIAALNWIALLPFTCWGLLAFMAYQWQAFGDPLAFVKTQAYWSRLPSAPLFEKLGSLAILEPLWGPFVPSSRFYWAEVEHETSPLFSIWIANPILFISTASLVLFGVCKRWLCTREIILAISLLAVPYVTKGYDYNLASGGRFAAVLVPMYLVVGAVFSSSYRPLAAAVLCISGIVLSMLAAMWAVGFSVF
jgi:hypothetical protein